MFELRPTPCAITKSDWEKDKSKFKTCVNPINVYHCIQDERNRSGEICFQPVWVQPRKSFFYFLFKSAPLIYLYQSLKKGKTKQCLNTLNINDNSRNKISKRFGKGLQSSY